MPSSQTTNHPKLLSLAADLTVAFPRSPRQTLAGYVIAARALDKCRATLAGTAGEYHFDCSLDRYFFDFSQIDADSFAAQAATGASDEEMANFIAASAKKDRLDVIRWNNQMRDLRLSDLPDKNQVFLEDYIANTIGSNRVVYRWFDVYDIEEGRL